MALMDPAGEMHGVSLGDKRLNARAIAITSSLQAQPSSHFPAIFDGGALEAFYRFTNNEVVEPKSLLEPHYRSSWDRAASGRLRIVVHDTTEFSFPGAMPREGLAHSPGKSVFFSHVSILVGLEEAPVVHGVVGMRSYVVTGGRWTEASAEGAPKHVLGVGSDRWRDAVAAAKSEAPPGAPLVHVMDREADDYPLLDKVIAQGDGLVCRSNQNRVVVGEVRRLADVLASTPFLLERVVWLSRRTGLRPPKALKDHPEREARAVRLAIRAGPVVVKRPGDSKDKTLATSLALNLVEVIEVGPPDGVEPVHWRLFTTLPVSTAAEAALVVDIYRKRWLIEEYFRALKTGCAVEMRQAESLFALLRTVALLVPVAVRLLQLRTVARYSPGALAVDLFDAIALAALNHLLPGSKKLPTRATAEQAMAAVALVGGHLKSNGPPGWTVLGRGYLKLHRFTEGWRAAIATTPASVPSDSPPATHGGEER